MRRSEIVHMKKLNACKFPSHFQFVVSYLASKDSPSPLRDLPRPVSTSRTHLLFHCHDSRSESLLKLSGMLSCHSDHLMIQQSSPPQKSIASFNGVSLRCSQCLKGLAWHRPSVTPSRLGFPDPSPPERAASPVRC